MSRVHRIVVVTLVVGLGAAGWTSAATRDGDRDDIVDTFLHMRVIAAVLDTEGWEARPFPGPTDGLIPATWLRDRIERKHRDELGPARDTWGGPLLYWSNGREYVIVSLGRDGRRQFAYDGDVPYRNVPRSAAIFDPADDLIVVNGVAWRGPTTQTELLRNAMADIRVLGTACESFAVDHNVYPWPAEPISDIAAVVDLLEPVYVRVAPRRDPWGNPYLFWSNGQHYAIVTLGSDGVADEDYGTWGVDRFTALEPSAMTEPGSDVVFVDFRFVRWPAVVP